MATEEQQQHSIMKEEPESSVPAAELRDHRKEEKVQFNGTYKLEKNENLEELLTKMEVNVMKRKVALMSRPSVEVKVEGDEWTVVTHATRRTVTWTFTPGQEKEFNGADGHSFKATFTVDGNKLLQETTVGTELNLEVVREFTEKGMIQHLTHKPTGVQCTRTFKRV